MLEQAAHDCCHQAAAGRALSGTGRHSFAANGQGRALTSLPVLPALAAGARRRRCAGTCRPARKTAGDVEAASNSAAGLLGCRQVSCAGHAQPAPTRQHPTTREGLAQAARRTTGCPLRRLLAGGLAGLAGVVGDAPAPDAGGVRRCHLQQTCKGQHDLIATAPTQHNSGLTTQHPHAPRPPPQHPHAPRLTRASPPSTHKRQAPAPTCASKQLSPVCVP